MTEKITLKTMIKKLSVRIMFLIFVLPMTFTGSGLGLLVDGLAFYFNDDTIPVEAEILDIDVISNSPHNSTIIGKVRYELDDDIKVNDVHNGMRGKAVGDVITLYVNRNLPNNPEPIMDEIYMGIFFTVFGFFMCFMFYKIVEDIMIRCEHIDRK